ncbi:MAG: carbohydrate binding family 9 domain-containing protein [Rhodothermaceae bacterium]|nr:carbohydrate binding family 9 domain-containing protein [Rhodothermaceae bacterium]
MHGRYILVALLLLAGALPAAAQSTSTQLTATTADAPAASSSSASETLRVLVAAPTTTGIRVDGVLDEADWDQVEPATDFIQFDPNEGEPASQRTEVRIVYGASAIYVGAMMYDDPEAIRRILSRRDESGGADQFLVGFDSYNDRKTAYLFGVTAAGVQFDALFSGNDDDDSWDAVWDSAVRITPEGWVAEMAIPYSQLRFSPGETSWGLEFQRQIRRNGEEAFWAPFTREQANAGIVQYFGRLEGLEGISPRRTMQATPYSLASANTYEHSDIPGTTDADFGGDVGADFKLGLTSSVTLDATVNPDFGQVEADPAQLNLSTFETFFEERRPFFLEGTQIFDFTYGSGDGALLYTRRVGGAAPIVGASKITGRLPSGLSFGVLGAATGDDFDPNRWYGAARVKQEFGNQNYVGGVITAFDYRPTTLEREDGVTGVRSLTGGADWDMRVGNGDGWKLEGSLAGSMRTLTDSDADDPTQEGYALYVGFDKVKGFFTPGSGFRVYSPGFEINDVGRFRQTNLIQGRLGANYLWNQGDPVGPFRRFETGGFADQNWRYEDGRYRGGSLNLFTGGQLRNFWWANLFVGLDGLGGFDVRETRGNGDFRNVRNGGFNVNINTDGRKRITGFTGFNLWFGEDGGRSRSGWLGANWNASDRIELSTSAQFGMNDNWTAWAANEGLVRTADGLFIGTNTDTPDAFTEEDLFRLDLDDVGADALLDGLTPYDDPLSITDATGYYVPVFGRRDTRTASITTRANVIFHPKLSLQLYGQLFAARGRYDDFQLLANPDELRDLDYPKRRDFSFQSLQANTVLRWEWRPGSTLFVVWTQSRNFGENDVVLLNGSDMPPSPFDVSTGRQLRNTFDVFPENVFLIKLNYLLMR